MRSFGKYTLIAVLTLAVLGGGYVLYMMKIANPRVLAELRESPDGPRAARVLLLALPDGREIPVNYLREGGTVYIGADGGWWRQFIDGGASVTLLIHGETLRGHAVAVMDQRQHTKDVFARLRPRAPTWLPDWLNGVLVQVTLVPPGPA